MEDERHRRKVPRREVDQVIGVLAGGVYNLNQAYEIGEGGLLISSKVVLDKGQKVVATFQVPGVPKAIVRGTVRYVRKADDKCSVDRYGIEFDKISFKLKRLIRNFVASRDDRATEAELFESCSAG